MLDSNIDHPHSQTFRKISSSITFEYQKKFTELQHNFYLKGQKPQTCLDISITQCGEAKRGPIDLSWDDMSFGQVFLYDILGDDTLQLVRMLNVLVYTSHGSEVELGSVIFKFSFLFFQGFSKRQYKLHEPDWHLSYLQWST